MPRDNDSGRAVERGTLRGLRKALGLIAPDVANRAGCPVEVVLRAEFGMALPVDDSLRGRLAAAYGITTEQYIRLSLLAAEREYDADRLI